MTANRRRKTPPASRRDRRHGGRPRNDAQIRAAGGRTHRRHACRQHRRQSQAPTLVCVYDVHAPSAEKVAAANGAKVGPELSRPRLPIRAVDAVLIASSTDTHVDLIIAAAKAGKAILCEKPIHLDIERSRPLPRRDREHRSADPDRLQPPLRPEPPRARDGGAAGEIGALEQLVITSRDPGLAADELHEGIGRHLSRHDDPRFRSGPLYPRRGSGRSVRHRQHHGRAGSGRAGRCRYGHGGDESAPPARWCTSTTRAARVYGYDQRVEAFGAKGMVQSDNLRASTLRRWSRGATDAQEPAAHFFIERYAPPTPPRSTPSSMPWRRSSRRARASRTAVAP